MKEKVVKPIIRAKDKTLASIKKWCEPDHINMIACWSRRGLTYQEISDHMGVCLKTLENWRKKSKCIEEALNGREMSICLVENALYREALGYYYMDQVVTNKGDIVDIKKYKPPSLSAQIFYLKNRIPKYWTDRREHHHTGDNYSEITVKWGSKNAFDDSIVRTTQSSEEDAQLQS
jgi:hypothetical protein